MTPPATHRTTRRRATSAGRSTYLEAISDGLREEMRRDETVHLPRRGHRRASAARSRSPTASSRSSAQRGCIDTPLAENAIIGAAVGAAAEGLKPVCEMQFADFISCGFDQLVNVAAKLHYRQGVAVPMVVRLPSGGGFSGGPFHSQNPEAWFLQTPGLKVVAPATAADAKGLLVSAIRDPNPVCFLEHKGLYRNVRGRGAGGRPRRAARQGARGPRGLGGERDRLRLERPPGAAGGRGAGRGHRGDRPAQPVPARHRGDPARASARPRRSWSRTRRRARAGWAPRSRR